MRVDGGIGKPTLFEVIYCDFQISVTIFAWRLPGVNPKHEREVE